MPPSFKCKVQIPVSRLLPTLKYIICTIIIEIFVVSKIFPINTAMISLLRKYYSSKINTYIFDSLEIDSLISKYVNDVNINF